VIKTAAQCWDEVLERLRAMASLRPDWDGYGAAPPEMESILNALVLSQILINSDWIPPISVIPTVNPVPGMISMNWKGSQLSLEFEIEPHGVIRRVTDHRTGETKCGTVEGFP
jgi:hypothetical protein